MIIRGLISAWIQINAARHCSTRMGCPVTGKSCCQLLGHVYAPHPLCYQNPACHATWRMGGEPWGEMLCHTGGGGLSLSSALISICNANAGLMLRQRLRHQTNAGSACRMFWDIGILIWNSAVIVLISIQSLIPVRWINAVPASDTLAQPIPDVVSVCFPTLWDVRILWYIGGLACHRSPIPAIPVLSQIPVRP